MRALTTTGDPARPVEMTEIPDPSPAPGDVLLRVEATSLNRGECRRAAASERGQVFGWDAAGTVERAAADGSGPPAGAPVLALTDARGWAELVAVPSRDVAVVPEEVPLTEAATLPVAAMTAYHALARGGLLLGRRVAVTGATGGVGHFALQMARLAGAHTTAIVSAPDRAEGLPEVDEVEVGLDGGDRPFDLILESVGGPLLADALNRVAPGGQVVAFGSSTQESTTFEITSLYRKNRACLSGFFLFPEMKALGGASQTLALILELLAGGRIDTGRTTTTSWNDAADTVSRLLDRRIVGKAVLRID